MRMTHPKHRWQDWWRVPRVALWLVRRPQDFSAYLKYNVIDRKTPIDIGMPWWSFGAVSAVKEFLQPSMNVFEFGSGGSSIFLASRAAHVTTIEDDQKWAELVKEEAKRRNIHNLEILHHPFNFEQCSGFKESEYLSALSDETYDLIVVDGQEMSEQVRDICFWHAEDHIKKGGVIVVDDSWRYPQIKKRNKALSYKDHKGTGYCRMGVTSTCLFRY